MKNVYVATVGRSVQPAKDGFRIAAMDSAYLLHSVDTRNEAIQVQEHIKRSFGHSVFLVQINAFDLYDVVANISRLAKENENSRIHINMTGGTNIMASGALLAGIIIRAEIFYLKEDLGSDKMPLEDRIIRMPSPKVSLYDLDRRQREIIALLARNNGTISGMQKVISNYFDISGQVTSYHVKRLESFELVVVRTEGRTKTVTLTETGRLFSQLI